jgi:hypothetical protein
LKYAFDNVQAFQKLEQFSREQEVWGSIYPINKQTNKKQGIPCRQFSLTLRQSQNFKTPQLQNNIEN